MPADASLLSALVEARKKDPQSSPLRLHVANLASFYRNVSLLGATLALFALFSGVGAGRFAITGSLLKLG